MTQTGILAQNRASNQIGYEAVWSITESDHSPILKDCAYRTIQDCLCVYGVNKMNMHLATAEWLKNSHN